MYTLFSACGVLFCSVLFHPEEKKKHEQLNNHTKLYRFIEMDNYVIYKS